MMTLAALLDIGIYMLFAFLLVICLLLLIVVLMQRPKQEGLGAAFGAALTDQAFGARTTDVLKKATIYLGTFFMVTVLALAILINRKYIQEEAANKLTQAQVETNAATQAAEQPEAPAKKSVADLINEIQDETETPAPTQPETTEPAPAPAPASDTAAPQVPAE